MWALTAVILTSIVMLVTGWGSKMVWLTLLAGSIWLAYNPPATTAQRVAQGAETLVEKGLKGVAPSVTPLVPNIIYTSPEEKAAADKAEADELKRQQELARIQAEGEARARVAAEAAAARELEATMRDAKAVNCVRVNTDKLGCKTVTFGYNTHYDRTARYDEAANGKPAKSYCINHDGGDAVITTFLGNNQFRFTAPSGLVVQFFDLPQGESYRGVRCG